MIALYLLAAHMAGDFVLQTRWQAAGKFGWTPQAMDLRLRHCAVYTLCFLPAVLAAHPSSEWRIDAFVVALFVLHWLTDSRRFNSTLGDVLAWRFSVDAETKITAHERPAGLPNATFRHRTGDGLTLPPSPWGPLPILIDQTLHLIQIAALAGLLLT